ncbi:dihydrolipoyllysine-residue acetyltransferase [Salicola sp. Rm-C-2C1-2]|uniref:dihydrolipoyllysine-residue acetyltransferase n=1 Tax=Salicola sp. Rm-C-2C1-2 TaxID=3141321 RepID=UPI0032E4FE8A
MSEQAIRVPELGGADSVEIVGVLVNVGDSVNAEDPLLELESDKATVELPAPADGTVTRLDVKEGDSLKEGDLVGMMETAEIGASGDSDQSEGEEGSIGASPARDEEQTSDDASDETEAPQDDAPSGGEQPIHVPELGGAESVEIVGVLVSVGDSVNAEDPLLELESDKATVEMPSPATGTITRLDVKQGDALKEGDVVGALEVAGSGAQDSGDDRQPETEQKTPAAEASPGRDDHSGKQQQPVDIPDSDQTPQTLVHAGPAVRKIAREFGVELTQVRGSGPKGRILKEDVQDWVKRQLESGGTQASAGGGTGIPGVELPDFSQFGEIERRPMNRIQKLTAQGMQRSWLNVPHVTQFEDADITDLEAFRQARKAEGESRGVKLTFVPFLLKACAYALRRYPQFNVSLDMANEAFIQKHYCHIGVAVDTPKGLVVPVVRDVDSKSIWQLAEELQTLAGKARDGKLTNDDMSGACFTLTSLGGIGGTAFTPIVNTPEVAILGVSKASTQPVWDGEQFQPRLMAPLSLSYDHRAINGADAARFTTLLSRLLGDLRELVM